MANLDTALKRLSGIHPSMPWRASYPLPDGTVGRPDRQVVPRHYSGILAAAPPTTAALTGTAIGGMFESAVAAGGRTIIITLANDTWVASGAAFNAQRQAIINGLTSAQAEAHGWNTEVRGKEVVGAVVRTSNTQVTVTLTASALYDITASETITVTVPSAALSNSVSAVVASPTITVSPVVVAPAADTSSLGGSKRKKKIIRGPYSDPRIYEEYIKRCIAERTQPRIDVDVAVLKEALVDQVELRQHDEEVEYSTLINENKILEQLLEVETAKRNVRAIVARQEQIEQQIEDLEEEEIRQILMVWEEM